MRYVDWPNQDAVKRGCSRDCRDAHSLAWGRCDLAEEPAPELNLSTWSTWTASDGYVSGGYSRVTVEEAEAEIARHKAALAAWTGQSRDGGESHG